MIRLKDVKAQAYGWFCCIFLHQIKLIL
jgi:hypothetical protein